MNKKILIKYLLTFSTIIIIASLYLYFLKNIKNNLSNEWVDQIIITLTNKLNLNHTSLINYIKSLTNYLSNISNNNNNAWDQLNKFILIIINDWELYL